MPDFLVGLNGLDLLLILGVVASLALIAIDSWRRVCAQR
jgi:hypothetical protein